MPNRIIKESICTSENIAALSMGAEVLFYHLIVKADDYGVYFDNEQIIRSTCYPLKTDEIKLKQVESWLNELVSAGLVNAYIAEDGKKYIQFAKWSKHQQIRAKRSKYPVMDDSCSQLISDDCKCPLGTLGTGNHFIEICLDESDQVWIMLHSGSRGIGNAIGTYFIDLAQKEMQDQLETLPSRDLAYFMEGTEYFDDYLKAVAWAQLFASLNRDAMMENVVTALQSITQKTVRQPQTLAMEEINCHHNYVQKEQHFGEEIYVTRKGAVSARAGQYGIIPGSMGAKSFIVRGLGNEESFCSCSHGAGRVMSRTKAKKLFSVEDQIRATAHVECRKDAEVIDEIPMAYKDIDAVMAAQSDLVEVIYTLRQVVCVKG